MFEFLKKKVKDSSDYGKKIVSAEEITEMNKEIKGMANSILSPKKTIANAKKETFLEAKSRLHLSDQDLIRNYKNYTYCFYLSVFFTLLCFLGILFNLFINKQIVTSLAMLGIFALCLVNCFRFSFRAFQIRHQKLCSVEDWWNRSNEWWPKLK